ncbi:hypothetical protein Vadar_000466 [Vaccinium darrowii]|uniref:Uncharacterized protein n=1 Tax=Vaccinium darrowii TaxID=229202 RepID=A0ACB7YJ87_9ERIC|nr:hypothetical protein Vadar_000466 [Vaccinium darrowii]
MSTNLVDSLRPKASFEVEVDEEAEKYIISKFSNLRTLRKPPKSKALIDKVIQSISQDTSILLSGFRWEYAKDEEEDGGSTSWVSTVGTKVQRRVCAEVQLTSSFWRTEMGRSEGVLIVPKLSCLLHCDQDTTFIYGFWLRQLMLQQLITIFYSPRLDGIISQLAKGSLESLCGELKL